ncbi:hypothetical protein HanRHA438_Chr04g0201501 [Helianthus annuus]|nr:hypothetical protein HanRHA438_Chr04g0201501 [Helianthus annuus]
MPLVYFYLLKSVHIIIIVIYFPIFNLYSSILYSGVLTFRKPYDCFVTNS